MNTTQRNALTWAVAVLLSAGPLAQAADGPQLSIEAYIDQVQNKNEGYRASETIHRSAKDRSSEADLLYMPQLQGNYQHLYDQKPSAQQPGFSPTATTADLYSLGLLENTNFGLSGKLTYTYTYTALDGVGSTVYAFPQSYTGRPMIELSQSLLRNGFGSEMRAQEDLIHASAMATSLSESFRAQSILLDAKVAYWKLAVAQRVVDAQKVFYDHAKKTHEWSSRRVNLQLADRTDLLQAEAALQLRSYELEQALEAEKNAARTLNSLRGIEADQVNEKLADLELPAASVQLPAEPMRADVKAAEQSARVAAANSQLGVEKNSATLEIYGSYALNSIGKDMQQVEQNSFIAGTGPTTMFGVRFLTPLDFSLVSQTKSAYQAEKDAAEMTYRRKVADQKRDYDELVYRIKAAQDQMSLLKKVEEAQNSKLKNERERLYKGRSTTYQVLQFEQDAELSQLTRIRAQGELLMLLAQLELYKGGSL